MGLVGLYACNVRRLRTEKRKTIYFSALAVACIALVVVCLVIASLVLFALLLCFVWFACLGCVVGGFLSLRMLATKRKGALCWCVLSSWVVVSLLLFGFNS